MIMTKAEAKRRGITEDQICVFHDLYPDQSALKGYQDCIIIRDSCGCDIDMSCEECDPNVDIVIAFENLKEKII